MKLYTYLIILIVLRRLFTNKRVEPLFFTMCSAGIGRVSHTHGFLPVTYMHIAYIFSETWPSDVRRKFGSVCTFRPCHGIVSTHIVLPSCFFQDISFFSIVNKYSIIKIKMTKLYYKIRFDFLRITIDMYIFKKEKI